MKFRSETEAQEWLDQVDALAAEVYNTRAASPREMTPERWEYVKAHFPGTVRVCREEAMRILAEESE